MTEGDRKEGKTDDVLSFVVSDMLGQQSASHGI